MPFMKAWRTRLEYSRFMGVGIRLSVLLVAMVVGIGLLVSACGSGGDAGDQGGESATGTERSERAERQASIMQQQADDSSEEKPELAATELGEIDFGHRQGLPFVRNVIGDPEAPVLIIEYSDFQ